eukprot:2246171-Rhodomonas_salina.1
MSLVLAEVNPNVTIRIVYRNPHHKMSAVDLAMAMTGRTKAQCNSMIYDSLRSADHGEKARRILWDKHQFRGAGQ